MGIRSRFTTRTTLVTGAVMALMGVGATVLFASDHQQTALTELNPRMDITDIYAFPGAGGTDNSRVTLVMDTSSPVLPSDNAGARFDPNLLYQFKIDNTGDGIEDLVIQVTFDSTANNNRVINVRGPAAPPTLMAADGTPLPRNGTATVLLRNASIPSIVGRGTDSLITITNAAGPIQVFAGLRDDPFFVDLEGFFRILPDRKPVSGPLAALPETPTASAFRGTAAPFETRFGPPVDALTALKANALSIVLEMPVALLAPGTNKKIGVWGTISR
jgi:Domain of unknown function (DUF4331)